MWIVAGFLLTIGLLQGRVHVVDAAGGAGAEYTLLQDAIEAAVDGEIVLIRSGDYSMYVDAKGLALVADAGASVRSHMVIQRLPAPSWVLVQGVGVPGSFAESRLASGFNRSARLSGNEGTVWLERCESDPVPSFYGASGPSISHCASVVLTRCSVLSVTEGGGGDALSFGSSRATLFECLVQARMPVHSPAPALVLRNSSISLHGSRVLGAPGEPGHFFSPNGRPGFAALVMDSGSQTFVRDSVVEGGPGGAPFGSGTPGPDGEDIVNEGGVVAFSSELSRSLEVTSPVREGAELRVTLRGKPGDGVWLRTSHEPAPGRSAQGPATGKFLLARGPYVFIGTVPPSGVLVHSKVAPHMRPDREGSVLFFQALVRTADTHRLLPSSPSAMVLLDEGL